MAYRAILVVYGLLNVMGGAMAYIMPTVKSLMSLIVGGAAGIALILCAVVAGKNPGLGFRAAGGITLALAAFWVYRILTLSAVGKPVGMAAGNLVLSLAVLGALGLGHFAARRKAA